MNDWIKVGLGVLAGIAAYGAYDYYQRENRRMEDWLEDEDETEDLAPENDPEYDADEHA